MHVTCCEAFAATVPPKITLTSSPRDQSELAQAHVRFVDLAIALGFQGASYFLLGNQADQLKPRAHWSSAGSQWMETYRRHQLHLADPRLAPEIGSTGHVVWDSSTLPLYKETQRFGRLASRHGIGSGIAMMINGENDKRAILSWDCHDAQQSPRCQRAMLGSVDTLATIGVLLLESVWSRPYLHQRASADVPRLTAREAECLALAANGMTSGDIGVKLGITQRTANFHFGNIIAKLQVLNRGEAIARAIALGLYHPQPCLWAIRG